MSSQVIGSNIGTAHSVAYQDRIYVHTYVHTYHISEMEADILQLKLRIYCKKYCEVERRVVAWILIQRDLMFILNLVVHRNYVHLFPV